MLAYLSPNQLSVLLAVLLVVVVVVLTTMGVRSNRRIKGLLGTMLEPLGYRPLPEAEASVLRDTLDGVFGEGVKLLEAMRHRDDARIVVRYLLPAYRVDEGRWDPKMQEHVEQVAVVVLEEAGRLPTFRLMPNSWAMEAVRGRESNVFHDLIPFGQANYVLGSDRQWVRQVLAGVAQRLLRENPDLTIDSRPGVLAFYRHGQTLRPNDWEPFLDQALHVAQAITQRAERVTA